MFFLAYLILLDNEVAGKSRFFPININDVAVWCFHTWLVGALGKPNHVTWTSDVSPCSTPTAQWQIEKPFRQLSV